MSHEFKSSWIHATCFGDKISPPPDKISHGVYDGICPCNMSPRFVASCVLTLKVRLHDATKLMRHATKSRCVNGLKAETHRTRNRNATRFSKVFKSEWNYPRNEYLEVLCALESTSYPHVIVILLSFSRGTNLFDSEITKIASRYGFASGVSRP